MIPHISGPSRRPPFCTATVLIITISWSHVPRVRALLAPVRDLLPTIDTKSQGRLDSPLHLTAYLLNPFYFYKDQTIQNDSSIMEAVIECVERFYPEDVDAQDYVINKELLMYKNKVGMFGKIVAVKGCEANNDNYDPGKVWLF
ncbi:hypothetical protein RHGRI_033950 [Rhododendron griersonianum]|uniref:Uncharacterized protein n=1 Tax=Rhododendron griersonianum TaxID=479676 RepID=A0AAV6I2K9_9ERIC|nr:hypothetical protein RHGRI_033950 [Rhododendron griersonianum]